jgi:ankyrin repeat protein
MFGSTNFAHQETPSHERHQGSHVMVLEGSEANWQAEQRSFQFNQVQHMAPADPELVIQYTLRGRMEELKEYLYQYPEAIDLKDGRNGNVAIHLAASKGNLPLMNFLVSKGANLNIQDMFGNTALHYATDKARKEMVLFLLNSGARINMQDYKGNSPLHLAAAHDDFEMVTYTTNPRASYIYIIHTYIRTYVHTHIQTCIGNTHTHTYTNTNRSNFCFSKMPTQNYLI